MKEYNHKKIEKKWQKAWDKAMSYETSDCFPPEAGRRPRKSGAGNDGEGGGEGSVKGKYYCLIEFPYPSGDGLHVGHVRSQTALDVIARKKRMDGFNVLYPIGWDAFGLPAENYAIKTGQHPAKTTKKNIEIFKKQIKSLGISFDWSREINTTDPEYYKWTQWIFLKLFEKGLAYKKKMPINWCPKCKIGLANEEVIDGKCERCGAETEKKELSQWMLKITAYADRLIDDLDKVDYLEKIKTQQINWIGRSEGAEVAFQIASSQTSRNDEGRRVSFNDDAKVKVFTTRPDTLFGATFLVLSPEHELVDQITTEDCRAAVDEYRLAARKKSETERTDAAREKTGVFTGAYAINPINNKQIPIWIADYVLSSYGTGAIMAVPAHDERDWAFAKKYGLPIVKVIEPDFGVERSKFEAPVQSAGAYGRLSPEVGEDCWIGPGKLINSGAFNGLDADAATEKIIALLEKEGVGNGQKQYHLRDWVFSRQHYWGEPIPLVFCEKCGGWVALPEDQLPLELPKVKKYEPTGTGESPLSAIKSWVNTTCPKCGGPARRETDTMPNWAGSSWYFLRYIDPKNNEKFADFEKLQYWLPVDLYNGGMEHTTLHLLYSRFWHKFLYDIGAVPTVEPYQRRVSHGMVLAPDGQKMSKSRGNVINPDDVVGEYGADVLRMYEMFMGPYDQAVVWDLNGAKGIKRFLDKVWALQEKVDVADRLPRPANGTRNDVGSEKSEELMHKTIKIVTNDIDAMKFNTAVSGLMILVNGMSLDKVVSGVEYKNLLLLLYPFAPHISSELWEILKFGGEIQAQEWPKYDEEKLIFKTLEIPVQINGKMRGMIKILADDPESVLLVAIKKDPAFVKYLKGKEIVKTMYVPKKIFSIVVK